jgi:hypothetical protein
VRVGKACISISKMFVMWKMRIMPTAVVISTLLLTCASGPAAVPGDDPTALAALQVKADHAQPRDKCFLYDASSRPTVPFRRFPGGFGDPQLMTQVFKQ